MQIDESDEQPENASDSIPESGKVGSPVLSRQCARPVAKHRVDKRLISALLGMSHCIDEISHTGVHTEHALGNTETLGGFNDDSDLIGLANVRSRFGRKPAVEQPIEVEVDFTASQF
jgi:hypothetical protein